MIPGILYEDHKLHTYCQNSVSVHLCLCRRKIHETCHNDWQKKSMKLFIVGRVAFHFPYMCCAPDYTGYRCPLRCGTLSSFQNQVFGTTCVRHTLLQYLCDVLQWKLITKTTELETKSVGHTNRIWSALLIVNCDAVWPSREEGWLWSL